MTQTKSAVDEHASRNDVIDALDSVAERIEDHGKGDDVEFQSHLNLFTYDPADIDFTVEIRIVAGDLRVTVRGSDAPIRVNASYSLEEVYDPHHKLSSTGRHLTPEFRFYVGDSYENLQEIQFSGAVLDTGTDRP